MAQSPDVRGTTGRHRRRGGDTTTGTATGHETQPRRCRASHRQQEETRRQESRASRRLVSPLPSRACPVVSP
ncbi:MAG: hypothetical protein ACK53Y_05385 [bacterium]